MTTRSFSSSNLGALPDAVAGHPPFDLPAGEYIAVATRPRARADQRVQRAGTLLDALRKLDALPWVQKAAKELAALDVPPDIERANVASLVRYLAHRPFDLVTERPWNDAYQGVLVSAHPRTRFVIGWSASPPAHDEAYAVLLAQPRDDAGPAARALIAAIAAGDTALARLRIADARGEIDATDDEGSTALHHAVAAHDVELVRALLEAGADPNAFAGFGNAPLFAARRDGRVGPFATTLTGEQHFAALRLLAEAGAEATATAGARNVLSLLEEAEGDVPEAWVELWIARGARPLALERPLPLHNALTALHYGTEPSAARRASRRFRTLIRAGADPNERNERGTVLHALLGETVGHGPGDPGRSEILPMARALLDAGAHEEPDRDGAYPGDYAIGWGYDEVVALLSRFSSAGLRRAALKGRRDHVASLLARGVDPSEPDPLTHRTALHGAAEEGHLEIAKLLIAGGADREARDRRGRIPRDLAVAGGHHDLAALLEPT